MYVGFFSTRNELISAIWNMSTFKQKLRNMPNLLDWRYLYLAFANCIHLNEILCGRHFFSSRLGLVSSCMAPFTLFLTAHATNLRTLFAGTNISMDIFFWLPAFSMTCNRTQFECREFILNNSLVFLPLFFFLWMRVVCHLKKLRLCKRTHCWFIGIANDFPFDLLNANANASAQMQPSNFGFRIDF